MALKISQEYQDIADQLINKYQATLGHIDTSQVLFLCEDEKVPKKYADTQVVKYPYTFLTNYKFIITVYSSKTIGMTDAQLHVLIMHELFHIDENFEKLVKHDCEDFSTILQTYGVCWDTDPNTKDPL